MMRRISDIMIRDFSTADVTDSVNQLCSLASEKDYNCIPVMDDGNIVGVITDKDLINSHPNRIAADAMTNNFIILSPDEFVWHAKEKIEKQKTCSLLVAKNKKIIGIIPEPILNYELGMHVDLLTGLYKADYIYYKGMQFMEKGKEISLIFFDIDKFGLIDKEYGHIIGNCILEEVAEIVKSKIPGDTCLCRFGGDEFLILTPYLIDKCISVARCLAEEIRNHEFTRGIRITAAIGIAGGRRKNTRYSNLLNIVTNLINIASLASTKAKSCKKEMLVANNS